MEKLFFVIVASLFVSFSSAHADEGKTLVCDTNCQSWHGQVAESGPHGQSSCVGSFFAPESATKFELQLYDGQGNGIFVNDAGVAAPRGGNGFHRIGIGCSFIAKADKLIACIDGPQGQRTVTWWRVNGKLERVVADHKIQVQFLDYN